MEREIFVVVKIDWDGYDDVCDELVLEDSGIYDSIKDGVLIELIEK